MFNLFQYGWFQSLGAIAIFVIWTAAFLSVSFKRGRMNRKSDYTTDKTYKYLMMLLVWSCILVQIIMLGILSLILALIFF